MSFSKPSVLYLLQRAAALLLLLLSRVELLEPKPGGKSPSPVHCLNNTWENSSASFRTSEIPLIVKLCKAPVLERSFSTESSQTCPDSLLKAFDSVECWSNSAKHHFPAIQAHSGTQKKHQKMLLMEQPLSLVFFRGVGKLVVGQLLLTSPHPLQLDLYEMFFFELWMLEFFFSCWSKEYLEVFEVILLGIIYKWLFR